MTAICSPLRATGFLAAAVALPALASDVQVVEVDIQLVLAADVSGSMRPDELRLQRSGYVAALRELSVAEAVLSGSLGKTAITYVEWAGLGEQMVVVPWTIVDGSQALQAFADQLEDGHRLVTGQSPTSIRGPGTSISSALQFAVTLFENNGLRSRAKTIDVSGDGPNDEGPPIDGVRDGVVAQGVTINGIAMSLPDSDTYGPFADLFGTSLELVQPYYARHVIGGPGAFVMGVTDMADFAETIERKLVLEISTGPLGRATGLRSVAQLGK